MSFATRRKIQIRRNEENAKNNIHPEISRWKERILQLVVFFNNITEFNECMDEFCKKNGILLVKNSPKTNLPGMCKHSTYNCYFGSNNGKKTFESTYDFNLTAPVLDSSGNGIILKAQIQYTSLPHDLEFFKYYFRSTSFPDDIVENIKETELKNQIINPFNDNSRYDFIKFKFFSKKYKEHKITMSANKNYTEILETLLPETVSWHRFDNSIFKNEKAFIDYYTPDKRTIQYILEFIKHFLSSAMKSDKISGISIFEKDILDFFQKYSKQWRLDKRTKVKFCKLICKNYLSNIVSNNLTENTEIKITKKNCK